uniref:Ig-like domain-containing protein n=1 Tax=Oreochromis aureus TaxID=47969 RepID=A0AAZ1XAR3_OREAU
MCIYSSLHLAAEEMISCTLTFNLCSVLFPLSDQSITAESGQNVTLPCRTPNNNIIVVEWSKADLGNEQYVLLYRDGQFVPDNQHPSFKNRVDLQDRQMKDRDLSLILKNVTINDAGTYECRVKIGNNRRKRANLGGDPISIIYLSVVDPPGDIIYLIVVPPVSAVLLVAAVVFWIFRKYKQRQSRNSFQHPSEMQQL